MSCALTNTEVLLFISGCQGGTVHQLARDLNVEPDAILNAGRPEMETLCRTAQKLSMAKQEDRLATMGQYYEEVAIPDAEWKAWVDRGKRNKDLLPILEAAGKFPWVHNAAHTSNIEDLRATCLAYSKWWNSMVLPIIEPAKQPRSGPRTRSAVTGRAML